MLKIKDNVDLKELEKFHFNKTKLYYGDDLVDVYEYGTTGNFTVRCDTRELQISGFDYVDDDIEDLFDLIQAGFVEKVGGQMERLTTKTDDMYLCSYCENKDVATKLGAFEDFMEENKIQDLDILKSVIELGIKDRQTMQKYLSMWQKLKKFITSMYARAYYGGMEYCVTSYILDKMQELEQGDQDGTGNNQ